MKIKYKRPARALLAALLLIALACGSVFAVNTTYNGYLDPVTGLPLDGSSSYTGEDSSRAIVKDNVYYDWNLHCYVYPIAGTLGEIYTEAADGMVLGDPVSVSATEDVSIAVYRDGEELPKEELQNLNKAGSYVVSLKQSGTDKRMFGFTLIGPRTNVLHTFRAPDGFYISNVVKDEETVYTDRYSLDMEIEGEYSVEYRCMATDMPYTFSTVIDRTPPTLTFKGKMDENNRMRSALLFEGLEQGDSIYLLRSGEQVQPILNGDGTGGVYDSGNYVMRVYDSAGNMTEYTFTILMYFNASSLAFFALVLAVIIAVIVYVVTKRRRLKIG
ncbi:MAG: hypothetical protein IKW92_07975 [Firmicutes bacterium]|nr:hypothetical protein [Bacillota bacterium]